MNLHIPGEDLEQDHEGQASEEEAERIRDFRREYVHQVSSVSRLRAVLERDSNQDQRKEQHGVLSSGSAVATIALRQGITPDLEKDQAALRSVQERLNILEGEWADSRALRRYAQLYLLMGAIVCAAGPLLSKHFGCHLGLINENRTAIVIFGITTLLWMTVLHRAGSRMPAVAKHRLFRYFNSKRRLFATVCSMILAVSGNWLYDLLKSQ